jgi:hypothetical protein
MAGAKIRRSRTLPNVQVHAPGRGMVWQGHGLGKQYRVFLGGGGSIFPGGNFLFSRRPLRASAPNPLDSPQHRLGRATVVGRIHRGQPHHAVASTLRTDMAYHRPPGVVGTPRA